ncbi:hypothetical protein, conserved [Eimeria tenella]|uniref:Uncharacterized protein n=1 Tax=Eimeria tenella TaxID=5802 RepID=U6KWM7_EIMTE|nr:hypothetical protein, conserved [Eimeria tenella]CDJ40759.1 hypothetical protein, conserved [Eimeria tenella]|eukprot:XP_013231509.1 hypothetical protein, conserved [Eimeria tenella]
MQQQSKDEAKSKLASSDSEIRAEIHADASSAPQIIVAAPCLDPAPSKTIPALDGNLSGFSADAAPQGACVPESIEGNGQLRETRASVHRVSHDATSSVDKADVGLLGIHIGLPNSSDKSAFNDALQDTGMSNHNIMQNPRKFQRNCMSVGAKRHRVPMSESRAKLEVTAGDFQLPTGRLHLRDSASLIGNEPRNMSYSAPAAPEARTSGTGTPTSQSSAAASVQHANAAREGELSWQVHQRVAASPESASPQMVKSVSPAGVIRIGGRNRRKRTKYDLAYKQMEELGPFEEEAKSVDLSKVSGNSFALELLRNPQQYSHDSWAYGQAWPVGADGRRLLLRKLRGVFWSNPEKWQRVLQEHNLYRRDLFTLATVQELFRVTHLMGAEAWDFLLKCTALTQKCDALTSKDLDIGEDDEPGSVSPRGMSHRTHQQSTVDACKSEDDLHSPPDEIFSSALPTSGFVRKRVSHGVRVDKEVNKRSRGRPRKAPVKTQRASSEPEDASEASPTRHLQTGLSTPTSEASRWLPEAESLNFTDGCRALLHSAIGERSESSPLQPDDENCPEGGAEMLDEITGEQRRLLASFMKTAPPIVSTHDSFGLPATGKSATSSPELRLALGGKPSNNMLRLTTHYAFMAQFMQCCMLVEVQRSLLRIAEEFKTLWPSDKDLQESSFKPESSMDPTTRACFDSLVRSTNVHMQFVQVIVKQLQRDSGNAPVSDASETGNAPFHLNEDFNTAMQQLQIQHMRDRLMFANKEQAPLVANEVIEALRDMADHVEQRPSVPSERSEKAERTTVGNPQVSQPAADVESVTTTEGRHHRRQLPDMEEGTPSP